MHLQVLLQLFQASWLRHPVGLSAAPLGVGGQLRPCAPSGHCRLPGQVKTYSRDVQHPGTPHSTGGKNMEQHSNKMLLGSCTSQHCSAQGAVS